MYICVHVTFVMASVCALNCFKVKIARSSTPYNEERRHCNNIALDENFGLVDYDYICSHNKVHKPKMRIDL